jgi:hypothetical protein
LELFKSSCFDRKSRNLTYLSLQIIALLSVLLIAVPSHAQTPAAAGSAAVAKPGDGFIPGWTAGESFGGSSSADGAVLEVSTAVGYNFSPNFGIDAGVPYYFVTSPLSIKRNNPGAVGGDGLGSIFADTKWNYPGQGLGYASTVHLTAPTGDVSQGFSTGHATWNWSNHFEHGIGNFTPCLDGGVGNSVNDTRSFYRPFTTFGYNAQFEGGLEFNAGAFSFTAAAYDVMPWGSQTVISRVFRCTSGSRCSADGQSTDRSGYMLASVMAGGAELDRDNGFSGGLEFKPRRYLDLRVGYTHSVPLQLNSVSFGISVDLGSMLHPRPLS